MPGLRPNKFWMFWGIMLSVLGIVLFNVNFIPEQAIQDANARVEHANVAHAESGNFKDMPDTEQKVSRGVIDFTKKAACRQNIRVIDTMVEIWHLEKGEWPKLDLSDIGRDKDYFPRGLPRCPVTGEQYRLEAGLWRVEGHNHDDIDNPFDNEPKRTTVQVKEKSNQGLHRGQYQGDEPGLHRGQEVEDRSRAGGVNP